MLDNGLEVISSGANVPFADEEIFMVQLLNLLTKMCRHPRFHFKLWNGQSFGYLMQEGAIVNDEAIFTDVSETIN